MPKRTTLHLSDAALAILGDTDNTSARINGLIVSHGDHARAVDVDPTKPDSEDAIQSALTRYGTAWRAGVPALTESHWMLLCDLLNSTWRSAATGPDIADALHHEILDAEPDGLGEKWGVDLREFALLVEAMTKIERVAIIEVVDRFWTAASGSLQAHRDILIQAGAKIEE